MFYKPLFIIVHAVKGLLKSYVYTVIQNEAAQLQKWALHTHTKLVYKHRSQVLAQINEVLL